MWLAQFSREGDVWWMRRSEADLCLTGPDCLGVVVNINKPVIASNLCGYGPCYLGK